MKIRLTRNTVVNGTQRSVGEEVPVEIKIGQSLIAMGKAVEVKAEPAAESEPPIEAGLHLQGEALIETELITDPLIVSRKSAKKQRKN